MKLLRQVSQRIYVSKLSWGYSYERELRRQRCKKLQRYE
jgi:hypothetical protein